ncbi:MAG: DUF3316 domain-containing protein [Prevotella sp.]|jgi:hypothetical protein|nr:DUF3316 domain-containing protein [Prevotella sp.]MCI1282402.1 DUF3316 domain-containing protein [Prevotella sp.]
MTTISKLFLAALLLALSAMTVKAQDDKIITNTKMMGIGSTNILDTYLSPEKYQGTELRYISQTFREKKGNRLYREIIHQGSVSYADNRSGDGGEMAGMYNFQYGWHWLIFSNEKFTVGAGGNIDANLGFIYNTRNSNNPAQARAYLNITPAIEAAYRFNIKNSPHTLRYELSVPLLGVMFSPNYGQSYYEIFSKGNYDHNVVPTWIGNAPSLRQMLTFDFTLWKTTFRIGYMGDYQQARVNNLKNHIYTHALVIGVVRKFSLIKMRP